MWKTVKQILLYIVAPFGVLLAIIQYLLTKNRELKNEVARKDAEKNIAITLEKKAEAEKVSKEKETGYEEKKKAYEDYIKNNPDDRTDF